MKNSMIVFKKQLIDTLKNKTVLIQFILFPAMTLIMENTVKMEGMPELFFTKLFSVMYMGMAPVTSMAAVISEEKEKGTGDRAFFISHRRRTASYAARGRPRRSPKSGRHSAHDYICAI